MRPHETPLSWSELPPHTLERETDRRIVRIFVCVSPSSLVSRFFPTMTVTNHR
jgi:hypothetical protein